MESPLDTASASNAPVPQSFAAKPRRSVRASGYSNLLDAEAANLLQEASQAQDKYQAIIDEARGCIGHGADVGAFPEEWDAQLLIDAGRTSSGARLVIFTPAFLKVLLHDERELDRAFKYILLRMELLAIGESQRYVFVYCHSGMDWTHPHLAHRLRIAYDILPSSYAKYLKRLYVVHATPFFRLSVLTVSPFLSTKLWEKISYVSSLDEVLKDIHPEDSAQRQAVRRCFPQLVQREDCLSLGVSPPLTFGVPLKRLCDGFGVDFSDKTTGRWYPRLPPALVFLCEALERQAADEAFSHMFTADSAATYDLVATLDEGEPLDPDTHLPALWCALKLFVDCLPSPLLGDEAFGKLPTEVLQREEQGQLNFLRKALHTSLARDAAYMSLYLASFLHTMCEGAKQRPAARSSAEKLDDGELEESLPLTAELAAEVFAPGFLRPRQMSQMSRSLQPACVSLIKTFIEHAEDEDLWIGVDAVQSSARSNSQSSSSSDEEQ